LLGITEVLGGLEFLLVGGAVTSPSKGEVVGCYGRYSSICPVLAKVRTSERSHLRSSIASAVHSPFV
jgi:hypothetical protein